MRKGRRNNNNNNPFKQNGNEGEEIASVRKNNNKHSLRNLKNNKTSRSHLNR
jgi:hypothetical protein